MSFTAANAQRAAETIARFPVPKSALISLLHLAQEQDGYVSDDAMREIAELTGTTPAEVKGTASFYEMFRFEPIGKYLVNVCTNISCLLNGGRELLDHACERLGVTPGETSDDGMFTIDEVECIAACTEAPCLQVNYRYRYRIDNDGFDQLLDDLRAGSLKSEIPGHGTLSQVHVSVDSQRVAGAADPAVNKMPVWMPPASDDK